MPNDSDLDVGRIIQKAKAGDSASLGLLIMAVTPTVSRWIRGMLPAGPWAAQFGEEVVAKTTARVVAKAASFAGQTEAEFLAWLYPLTRRCCTNALKKHFAGRRGAARTGPLEQALDVVDSKQGRPDLIADLNELRQNLDRLTSELPKEDQDIVRWRREGYKETEIADMLGTHKVRIHRRIVKLRRLLRERACERGWAQNEEAYQFDQKPAAAIDARAAVTTPILDVAGNASRSVDAENNWSKFIFGSRKAEVSDIDPHACRTTCLYDAGGNLTATVDGNGHLVT